MSLIATHSFILRILFAFATCLLGTALLGGSGVFAQSTYIVDSTGDDPDASVGDGSCVTAGGDCTLRAALEEANADGATDVIDFSSIPVDANNEAMISVGSDLDVNETVQILGRTAPGYATVNRPVVVLDGTGTVSGTDGLEIGADDVVVEALSILNFEDDGIDIRAGNGVRVSYCYVGIEPDGITEGGNFNNGIELQSTGVIIGATDAHPEGGNVISENGGSGVFLNGTSPQVRVGGNIIGLDATGSVDKGNSTYGVIIPSGTGSEVGYTSSGGQVFGNVISGNGDVGVLLGSDGHTLVGNIIGLAEDQSTAIPNRIGVFSELGASIIGPTSLGAESNVIAGNNLEGIRIGRAGSSVSSGNTIQGNYIGVSTNGTAFSNTIGVQVESGLDNRIQANVIGGNGQGVTVENGSLRNVVSGNRIGVSESGADIGNSAGGVTVTAVSADIADANQIGGSALSAANVIGFNSTYGISVEGSRNVITANYVGTDDAAGNFGNDGPGIRVLASDVMVGEIGVGSVAGFNNGDGILVQNASNVTLAANYVGETPSGDDVGNSGNGIHLLATSGNSTTGTVVGYGYGASVPSDSSPSVGAGNVSANNGGAGVTVQGAGTLMENAIRGNSIFSNTSGGIDLAGDGTSANDSQDADAGPNNLQNFPAFSDLETEVLSNGDVQVRYLVDCDPANCDYGTNGLRVDFYRAESDVSSQGDAFIGTTLYEAANAGQFVTTTFTPPSSVSVQPTNQLVGIATDASGNSSEFTDNADALPVEIGSFTGSADGEAAAILNWTTLSEDNNSGFYVQQKVEGSFQTVSDLIESAASNGTSTEQQSYDFRVEDLERGMTHTFRLRQVDVDGDESFSKEIDVRVGIGEAYTLEAYPNPITSRQTPTIRFAVEKSQPVTVEVYNTLGQRVRTLYDDTPTTTGQFVTLDFDASSLSSGIYFIRMRGESFTTTEKLVVVR